MIFPYQGKGLDFVWGNENKQCTARKEVHIMRYEVNTTIKIHTTLLEELKDAYEVLNQNGLYNNLDEFIQDTIELRIWEHIQENINLITTANRYFVITDRK